MTIPYSRIANISGVILPVKEFVSLSRVELSHLPAFTAKLIFSVLPLFTRLGRYGEYLIMPIRIQRGPQNFVSTVYLYLYSFVYKFSGFHGDCYSKWWLCWCSHCVMCLFPCFWAACFLCLQGNILIQTDAEVFFLGGGRHITLQGVQPQNTLIWIQFFSPGHYQALKESYKLPKYTVFLSSS